MKQNRKAILASDEQIIDMPAVFGRGHDIRLLVICAQCLCKCTIGIDSYWNYKKKHGTWLCLKCRPKDRTKLNALYATEEYKQKFRDLHKDPEYAVKVHNDVILKKISESAKKSWQDENKRKNQLAHRKKKQFKDRISRWAKGKWADATYRSKQLELRSSDKYVAAASERSKALWQNAGYRKKITEILDKARPKSVPPRISSLQLLLYSVLDDIGIEYYPEGPETIIGPIITSNSRFEGYSWDCCLIHNNKRIYVDVHGDYWHRENREHRDRAKATFLKKYFPQHDILIIWEHEFRGVNNIRRIILDKLGISKTIQVDFDFKEIEVGQIDISNELKALFANYHYLGNIGRFGSFRAGAILSNKLVAAATFGHPTRKESVSRLGLDSGQLFELSRFCIHGNYQKRNFASWFLTRSTKIVWDLFPKVKTLLTFADTTNGHIGTIYKAAGWKFDGEVRPSYWYIDGDGAWYHKKSMWDLAIKNSMSEHDYATSKGFMKISGGKKLRFLLSKIG